jgi:branched-chain amino acid transport system substrate-binding protein
MDHLNAYPFLISRNYNQDYRLVYGPSFCKSSEYSSKLFDVTGYATETDSHDLIFAALDLSFTSLPCSVVYRVIPASGFDIGEDSPRKITDNVGRTIYHIEGILSYQADKALADWIDKEQFSKLVHIPMMDEYKKFWNQIPLTGDKFADLEIQLTSLITDARFPPPEPPKLAHGNSYEENTFKEKNRFINSRAFKFPKLYWEIGFRLGLVAVVIFLIFSAINKLISPGPLRIGAVISLTGNDNVIGQDQRIGLELARNHFQDIAPALELHIEDGGSDDGTAINAFRSLINNKVAALIGPTLSKQAFAVDPIAGQAGIPQIGPSVLRASAPVAKVAPLLIDAALKLNPAIQRAAVFYAEGDAYSSSESKIFLQTLVSRGITLVSVNKTSVSDTDFHNKITDTLNLKPELIVISALPSDGGNLVRQIRELGFKGILVAGNGMNSPNIYPICQRFCNELLIAQSYNPKGPSAINKAFLDRYRKAQEDAVPPQSSAEAFTAYQMVAKSLATLQRQQPAGASLAALPLPELHRQLSATLFKGTYQTPLGTISFTPKGEVIQQHFYVAQVHMAADGRSGRFLLLP